MSESSSLAENPGIPNSVRHPRNTWRAAVESRSPCPSDRITWINRHRRRREHERAVRGNSYIDCCRACLQI